MALTYKIKDFRAGDAPNHETHTRIGFEITDETNNLFIIEKEVTKAGKTDEQMTQEALALCTTEIDEWQATFVNVGRRWNPDTDSFE